MSLALYVDGSRWRGHLTGMVDALPGLVPVAKGNGYGFGLAGLGAEATRLGLDTVAVGTYPEVEAVRSTFTGDVVVLQPWRPDEVDVPYGDRIVHTVSRSSDVTALSQHAPGARVILEGLTSMRRFGMQPLDLADAARDPGGLVIEGHALHLPMGSGTRGSGGNLAEVERVMDAAPAQRWWVSHLSVPELDELRGARADVQIRPRIGTSLWLGDRGALQVRATVLDRHQVARGERVGYRQRAIGRRGTVVIVSGGTAHGIGLEAPTPASTARQRAVSVAKGGLDAAGRALSPFTIGGRQRWFAEPPHMQASMIFVPDGVEVPEVGDDVPVDVRFTTTYVDRVVER